MNYSLLDKRLFYSFCLLVFWLPLPLGSNRAWAWSMMEIWVFGMMICWCWLYYKDQITIPAALSSAKFVLIIFVLWLILIALQLIPLPIYFIDSLSPKTIEHIGQGEYGLLSLDQNATEVSWLLSLCYFLIFFLCLALVRDRKRLKIIAYVLLYSGFFQALFGAMNKLLGISHVATGTFVNRNHLAGYLEMTLAVGIGLLIASLSTEAKTKTTWKKKIFNFFRLLLSVKVRLRLSLVVMVIALVLTYSRMGNIAFFVSLILAGIIHLLFCKYTTKTVLILLMSLIVVDLLVVGQWFGLEKLKNRIQRTSIATESRDEAYEYTWNQWQDYRLVGSGLGSFYTVFPHYRDRDIIGYYSQAHNDYLQFITETGMIGIFLLGLIILSCLIAAIVAQRRRRDPLMLGISFAAMMGIIAILIHSTVDFNLQIPVNAATFVILLAFCWISLSLGRSNQKKLAHHKVR